MTTDMGGARPIVGSPDDYDSLLDLVGNRRFVLLGEATHGTHDFYRERKLGTFSPGLGGLRASTLNT